MPDISQLTPFATSTPEQAASNIQNANVFSLNPVPDKSFNEQASQQIEDMTKPTYAAPAVKDYMSQSTEHTALALPDTPKLNFIDETAKYIGDIVYNRPTDDQKIVDLNLKKMQNGGQLSDDDNYQLWQLNQDRIEQQKNTYNEPPSFIEKVGEAVLDTGRTLRRHAPLIGAFTGAGAAIGEFTPFGPAGAVAGAGAGFGAGIMSAFSVDAYDSLAGGTYNELSNMTKEDGTPMKIDESTKANISHGVGAIGAAVNAVLGKALVDTTPFIKSVISPSMAKNLILNPANAALLKTVTNIGEVALTGAGAGAATETSRIIAEEMGKTYDGSQASFLNALAAAGDHLKANAERVGGAAAVGAATGAALAGATGALGFGRTKANFEQRSRYTVRAAMDEYFGDHSAGARDVAPTVPEGGPLQIAGSRDVTPANPDAGPSVGPSAPENSITQSTKVLQLRDAMEDMSTAANQTKMKELAPGEMADVMKGVFSRAGISKLYTTLQNLRDFSVDPEKGKAARNLLDPSGYFASQVDAPIEVDPVKVMEVAHDHPEILDHMKVQPDGPSAMQAKQYLESLQAASQKRQEIFTKLGIKPEDVQPEPQSNVTPMPAPKDKGEAVPFDFEGSVKRTDEILKSLQTEGLKAPEKAKLQTELEGIKQQVADHFKSQQPGDLLIRPDAWDEPNIDMTRKVASEYVNAPTFTEALQKALPKAEVQKYNVAQQNARTDYATHIRESAEYEMNQVQDIQVEEAKQVRKQQEIDRIANDPNYAIVDRFRRDVTLDAKGKKGHSIYSIDPRSLPKELEPYLDNARLKEHKVFAKGGITADDAAQMLGVKNGAELLSILSKTPTREQVAKARAAAFAASDEQEARDSVDLNNTRAIQALRDQTKAHLAEMKFMREQEWPATKSGIKRIALPLPKIEELTQRARDQVKRTKIGSLNPRQFEVGERKSNKVAVNAILKNEVEKAFLAKENAALNSELEKETKIATAEFNRAARFFRKFNEKGTQQILKDAGSLYVNAANEIRGVFNLSPSAGESAELGSYQKYVKKMVDEGKGDFSIPEALSDIRQSVNDLTVEQVRVLHDRLAALLSQAKFKNKLIAKHDALAKEAKAEDVERFANEVVARLADHPGNSERRLQTGNNKSFEERPWSTFDSIENLFTAKQFVYKQLDHENPGGWFYHNFDAELEGSGEYFEKTGYTKNKKMTKAAVDKINKITEAHGNFDHEMGKILQIPEFKNIKELNNGWLSKGDLAMLWAYRGQQYTKDLLFKNNGNVGDETWNKIFFRELDKKDFVAIQKLVDTLKDYHPEVIARMKRSGRDPHIIQGIPNQISDTESTAGGYVRARYQHAFVKNRVEKLTWEDTGDRPANELTDEGYLKTRSGSGEPLDYSLRGLFLAHAEIIHDLSYSEPLENFKKKIENDDIRAAIIKVVGEPKLNTVIDKNLQIGNRLSQNGDYFRDANNLIMKTMNSVGNNFSAVALSFNPSTPIVQFEALGEMARVLGPKSLVHLARINAMLIKNIDLLPGFIDAAMKLDPNLEKYFTGIGDKAVHAIDDLVPQNEAYGKTAVGKVGAFAKNHLLDNFSHLHDLMMQGGFLPISAVDAYLKAVQAHTVYQMVREGDFPNYPKERLEKMTPKEIHEAGQAAAQQMSSLTMIQNRKELQSPVQDMAAMKAYTFFWNYQRNILNNHLAVARKVAWEVKKGTGPVGSLGGKGPSASGQREGIETRYTNHEDHGSGGNWKMNASKMFLWSAACSLAMLYLHKVAHGQKWNPAEDQDLKTVKGVTDTGKNILADLAMSQIDLTTNATPILNTTVYAAQHRKKYQLSQVTNPETQILTAFATGVSAVYDKMIFSHPMSRMEKRAALEALGYAGLPLPLNAWYKGMKWLNAHQTGGDSNYLAHFQQAQFNTSQIDNQQKDFKAFAENPPKGADPHFVAQVDQLQKQLAPQTATVPPQANDIVKIAESGGNWSEPNGLYGFSSSDWKTIMRSAPELGLTENGRTAKDTTQQEKAIDWSLHENAQRLAEKDLPVNNQTLFGAHKLGVENYIKVFNAGANEKLKSVLDEGTLKQNPEIANFKTIGQVKLYLNSKVDSARKVVEKDNSLTSNAPNTED